MTMENLPARTSGAGPLADYAIGMRVMTREGYPGVIDDILEAPADLTTYWVTLDGGLGGGEYAEAEIWPLAAQQTASQMASEAGVERTAADDYPELENILAERLPPQITTTAGARSDSDDLNYPALRHTPEELAAWAEHSKERKTRNEEYNERWYGPSVWDKIKERFRHKATNDEARDWNDAGAHEDMEGEGYVDPPYPEDIANEAALKLALYLPPKPPSEQASSTTPLNPQEKTGFHEGFEHGKEGLTRAPSLPLDAEYMAGYDLGWAEGVLVYRKPPDSEANTELENAQIAGTFPDALGPMRASLDTSMPEHLQQMEARGGLIDLGMPVVASEHEAGALMDFIKGDPEPNKYWKGIDGTFSYDWCRYRKDSHCWLSKDLNEEASKQAGYAVWNPVDRGYCPRIKWEDQMKCPVGAPGEHVPGGFTNATVPWDEGGQRGGTPSGQYRQSAQVIDMTPPLPKAWEGPGIYEVDMTGRASTGAVALMVLAMKMPWPIAWLSWDKSKRTIEGVWVDEDNRGKGIGAELLAQAAKVAGGPLVDSGEHTNLGYEWAKKRGLNPTRKIRTPENEMSRMTAQMLDALIGGQRITRLLLPVGGKKESSLHTAAFEVTATWADVRRKAKRIRESGGVRMVASKDDTVTAHVRGDHGIYETTLRRNPGKRNVAYWHCGCKWAAYAWGRSPAYKRFEGRMCSHALAVQYEAQARSMFGREMTLDEKQPAWMDQKHIHHPGDYRRDLKRYTSTGMHPVDAAYDPDADPVEDLSPVAAVLKEAAQAACPICGDVMMSQILGMSCMRCGTLIPYVSTENLFVTYDEGEPVFERAGDSLKDRYAAKAAEFFARVRGVIRKVVLDEEGPKVEGKEKVSPREIFAPNWHPTKGLNVNDNSKLSHLTTEASGTDLKAAAKAMLEMARRNEPDTTTMMAAEALTHGGQMFGLDYRFKSEGSLLRKMEAETHEFGHDAGMTAANMSDTLRYTMLFPTGNYTQASEAVLNDLKRAGYNERVKNYWERGDAYNGLNAAMMTPKGHPFELQFHTPESIDMKERVVHPIYEKWRTESNPKKKAEYAYAMRDAFDTVSVPSGVLSIPTLKRQPMPEEDSLRAAALDDTHKYLRLHYLHGGDTTAIIRLDDNGVVEVYKDGKWVEDSHYGRYFFKGEARSDEITPEQAEAEISGLSKESTKKKPDETVSPSEHGDPRMQDAGVTVSKTKDGKYYVHTHRARGKYRDSVADIPDSEIEFIRSTGMIKTADDDQCPRCSEDSCPNAYRHDGRIPNVYDCPSCGARFMGDEVLAEVGPFPHPADRFADLPEVSYDHPQFPSFVPAHGSQTPKEGSKMDFTPDEFGSLFDDAMGAAPLTGGIAPIARQQEWDLDVTSGFATMNEEPEPALPATDGADEEEKVAALLRQAMRSAPPIQSIPPSRAQQMQTASVPPPLPPQEPRPMAITHTAGFPLCAYGCNHAISATDALVNTTAGLAHANCPRPVSAASSAPQSHESAEERGRRLLAYVDASLSGQEVGGPNPFEHLTAGQADNEMKLAAERFLTSDASAQKTALKTYDLAERNAIINEGEGTEATNLDRLDISGTHYEAIEAANTHRAAVSEDEDLWMLDGDPNGPMDI